MHILVDTVPPTFHPTLAPAFPPLLAQNQKNNFYLIYLFPII